MQLFPPANSVAWSSDGKQVLLSFSGVGTLWDVRNILAELPAITRPLKTKDQNEINTSSAPCCLGSGKPHPRHRLGACRCLYIRAPSPVAHLMSPIRTGRIINLGFTGFGRLERPPLPLTPLPPPVTKNNPAATGTGFSFCIPRQIAVKGLGQRRDLVAESQLLWSPFLSRRVGNTDLGIVSWPSTPQSTYLLSRLVFYLLEL